MLENNIKHSLFSSLTSLSERYNLPSPLSILQNPPSKYLLKKIVSTKISDFWHTKLSSEASAKKSLKFLKCAFLPLGHPHMLWESCSGSPRALQSAIIQARLLSGRYRCDYLVSKWSNSDGSCRLPGCHTFPGDSSHLLSGTCPALRRTLILSLKNSLDTLAAHPLLLDLVKNIISSSSSEAWVAFILDPSTNPAAIKLMQDLGKKFIWPLFRLSRTYIWAMHKQRSRFLGIKPFWNSLLVTFFILVIVPERLFISCKMFSGSNIDR